MTSLGSLGSRIVSTSSSAPDGGARPGTFSAAAREVGVCCRLVMAQRRFGRGLAPRGAGLLVAGGLAAGVWFSVGPRAMVAPAAAASASAAAVSASASAAAVSASASAAAVAAPSADGTVASPSADESTPGPAVSASLALSAPEPVLPSPVASGAGGDVTGAVELSGRAVFTFRVSRDGRSPRERAVEAERVLARVAGTSVAEEVIVARRGELAVVMVGSTPILHLGPEDARAAGAESVDALAAAGAAQVRVALAAEHRRAKLTQTVLSISLVALLGLVALFLVRLGRKGVARARRWLETHSDRVPALSLRSIEVVNARVVRGALSLGITATGWIAQLGVAYAWLVFAFSRFETTRGYTQQLAGFVLSPLGALVDRLATGVSIAIVGLAVAAGVAVALRFFGLYFAAVERGESQLAWVAPEHAAATGLLVRGGLVVIVLVFLGPLVTGDNEGPLALLGGVAVGTLGLAATPLVAGAMVGALNLYQRRLSPGMRLSIGGISGRLVAVDLFELRLVDGQGQETRVSHLSTLLRPLRVAPALPRVGVRLVVPHSPPTAALLDQLRLAASAVGDAAQVEILGIRPGGTRVRVSVLSADGEVKNRLFLASAGVLEPRAGAPRS